MASSQRKIVRKHLKEPDEFETFLVRLEDFATTNWRQLLIGAAAAVVIVLLMIGIYSYQRHNDHVVAGRFYDALSALNSKQYRAAQEQFSKLAADESGRELGRLARFYVARCYAAEGDLQHARDALVAYVAEARDETFRGIALMDLGAVYENLHDLKKAEGIYRQAASEPGPSALDAQLALARVKEAENDRSGAIAEYKHFIEEHPFAPQRQEVTESLARLGVAVQEPSAQVIR